MILFLKERMAWILFIISLLSCINLLFYLDSGFSGVSIRYFNIVIFTFFLLFIIYRYIKERQQFNYFLGNLSNRTDLLSLESNKLSPFQRKLWDEMETVYDQKDSIIMQTKVLIQEEKEEILAWVHEMKTPLTATKLMIEQIEDPNLRNALENEWLRTHLLLDQQLHNTRIATIEKDNRLEKVLLRSIVTKEIRELQTWCMEKGIGFQTDNLEVEVVTDKKWLSFIVRQILSNAIKYSNKNEEINVFTNTDEDGHILLHIQDFGVGIPAEDIPRIFNKSYTGTIGRESVQSTGMGLYLVKSAADKLGIQMAVKSSINDGTTFTLQFPNQNNYQSILGR